MFRLPSSCAALLAALALAPIGAAQAAYPERTITMVCASGPAAPST